MSEQSKRCNTYDEMNQKIVGILRVGDNHPSLYAAQRIEELEEQLEQAQEQLSTSKTCHDLVIKEIGYITAQYKERCREIKGFVQENKRLKEIDKQGITLQLEYARQNKLLVEQNQKLIEALEEIQGTLYGDVMTRMRKMQGIADKALQEVQHGTSKET